MGLSRKLLFGASFVAASALACNGIIGLSDYQYGECPGARCSDGSFPDLDGNIPDGNPPIDSGKETGPGAQPVSWAQWPMPGYDGGPGVPLAYDVVGSEIKDKTTNLVWQKSFASSGNLTYADAVNECKKLGNWRLPKRIELVTLLDFGAKAGDPKVNAAFDLSNDTAWTSSEYRVIDNPNNPGPSFDPANPVYWVVNFSTGQVDHRDARSVNKLAVLCVKAGP